MSPDRPSMLGRRPGQAVRRARPRSRSACCLVLKVDTRGPTAKLRQAPSSGFVRVCQLPVPSPPRDRLWRCQRSAPSPHEQASRSYGPDRRNVPRRDSRRLATLPTRREHPRHPSIGTRRSRRTARVIHHQYATESSSSAARPQGRTSMPLAWVQTDKDASRAGRVRCLRPTDPTGPRPECARFR